MHNPVTHDSPALIFQASRRSAPLGLAGPPSFARALRQRGLIAPAPVSGVAPGGRPIAAADDADWSIHVLSTFELHLRRRSMEQAFAELRGDAM
ncbi:MAG: hypothetical protein JSR15_10225 [Proteobacteria bacterium]|nr:hypothetical protein [Pseudomonadota bacterium]